MIWIVMTMIASFILGTHIARVRATKRLLDVEPNFPLDCPENIDIKNTSAVLDSLVSKGAYTTMGGRTLVMRGRDESSLAFLLETGVVSITPNGSYVTTPSRTKAFREWAALEREWDKLK